MSALAVFPDNLIMMDSVTGEEVTRIPLGDAFRKKFHHPYALIHRADLHKVLLEACRKSDLIRLDAAQKVVKVEETGDGIAVQTESGKEYRGAALIGADGLWSTIRQVVVGDGKPNVAGHITYRAVLPTSEMPEQYRWRDMVLWAGEKVHLVHYPLRTGELFNLVAVFHSDRYQEGWDSFGDPAELHERFAKTCAPVRTLLNKIESWRMWVLCDRPPIKNWSRGRITLLGDAAHPMLQYLAQGANMSIEDAVCLANKVVEMQGDYLAAFQRLSADAVSADRPCPDHGAGLRRILSCLGRGKGAPQHDARLAHAGGRHGRDGMALRAAAGADAGRRGGGMVDAPAG